MNYQQISEMLLLSPATYTPNFAVHDKNEYERNNDNNIGNGNNIIILK